MQTFLGSRPLLLRVFLLVLALAVMAAMLGLGWWQLQRAAVKQQIADDVALKSQVELDLGHSSISLEQRYASTTVAGRYLQQQTFFLDSQTHYGQVGYHVVTPFQAESSEQLILVNRGWVSAGSTRAVLPQIDTPEERLLISGRLNLPASKPLFWDDSVPIVQNGAWQFLSFAHYEQYTGLSVAPLLLELDKTLDQVGGYVRQWRTYDDQWIDRHRAYAVQWFSMAVFFLFMCLFVLYKSKGVKGDV